MEMFECRWGGFLVSCSGASRICFEEDLQIALHQRLDTGSLLATPVPVTKSCIGIKRSTSRLPGGDQLRRAGGNTKDNLILFLFAPFIHSFLRIIKQLSSSRM